MTDIFLNAGTSAIAALMLIVVKLMWALLSVTAFRTPDITPAPQVVAITDTSLTVVNIGFGLAVLATGLMVMARESIQARYGLGELLPRLVVGWIAANFARPICQLLIQGSNALITAFTGDDVGSQLTFTTLRGSIEFGLATPAGSLLNLILAAVLAVLTGLLLVAWITRVGTLIVLVGISPAALACHATPFTDPAARLWWRAMLATLGTVMLQALGLHVTVTLFLSPAANPSLLGFPHDKTGLLNEFVIICLLWAVIKIPAFMRRYVTGGGKQNTAGLLVRMLIVQQLTRGASTLAGRLLPRRAGTAAAGYRRTSRRWSAGGGWSPRMPQPIDGGTRPTRPATRQPRQRRRPQGAGPDRVATAWPTGRPVHPYTVEEIAAGVDPYTRKVRQQRAQPEPTARPARTPDPKRRSRAAWPPPTGPWRRRQHRR